MYSLVEPNSLFISNINGVIYQTSNQNKGDLNYYVMPIYKLIKYYQPDISSEYFKKHLLNEDTSSVELSVEALKEVKKEEYDLLVYCQNQADNRPLNSPLASIIFNSCVNAENYIGLSHLENIASVEGIKLMNYILKKKGLLLMTEKMSYNATPRHFEMNLGNSSVCLEVSKESGHKIDFISTKVTESDGYIHKDLFLEEFKGYYTQLSKLFNESDTVTVIQNRLTLKELEFIPNLYKRTENASVDYQSGDVWVTVKEILKSNNVLKKQQILVMTTNFRHKISCCAIHIN
ncbi:hypothetical protein QGM71_18255 [Virgibacillus sp. C22-A2]|uniref:Uncharacterized protein n=1 Tax=Virgibacillus tibetensis TaxID=3042313 RepID=A0ABU6KJD0_9BACI|nr:hypothetical protein [Virgibacillus sp. C22-A2]